jgi:glycosyltransferase involved in cell wall biosynthesis
VAAPGLLLVGHDAFEAGAQRLLLHLARRLVRAHGLRVEIVLLGGGALEAAYAEVAPTVVLADPAQWERHFAGCAARGLRAAIVNSAVSAAVVPVLAGAGIPATLLVHELPRLLAEKGAEAAARAGAAGARRLVFAAEAVRDGFAAVAPFEAGQARILPQGNYQGVGFDAAARARVRRALGLAEGTGLVLGAGYADLRKGFDLFLQAWRILARRRRDVVFAWIGGMDPGLAAYLGPELAAARAGGRFVLAGPRADAAEWFSAADAFCLPSREDPFPTVAVEALAAGLEVAAFAGAGGVPGLLEGGGGEVVALGDAAALAGALGRMLGRARGRDRAALGRVAGRRFGFGDYARAVLGEAMPGLARVSVVVPSFNYARHMAARLASVFAQAHPVEEVLVLDDASTDGSVAEAERVAAAWGREISVLRNARNGGAVMAQWRRGVEMARGDWVWIAEADDEADPAFLATLAGRLEAAGDVVLAACDSRAVAEDGAVLWPDHQDYFALAGAEGLRGDGLFGAREFAARFLGVRNLLVNASALLFRRDALLAALRRCEAALAGYRMAGDWHLYLELLAPGGAVAWVAAPLNSHRRHGGSVTGALEAGRHLAEIARVQAHALAVLGGDAAMAARQAAYREELAATMGVAGGPRGRRRGRRMAAE